LVTPEYEIPAAEQLPDSGQRLQGMLNSLAAGGSGITINADGYIVLPEI